MRTRFSIAAVAGAITKHPMRNLRRPALVRFSFAPARRWPRATRGRAAHASLDLDPHLRRVGHPACIGAFSHRSRREIARETSIWPPQGPAHGKVQPGSVHALSRRRLAWPLQRRTEVRPGTATVGATTAPRSGGAPMGGRYRPAGPGARPRSALAQAPRAGARAHLGGRRHRLSRRPRRPALGRRDRRARRAVAARGPASSRPISWSVDRVDARWSRGSLLGHGPAHRAVAGSGVALTVVVDEHGHTSFDALPQSGRERQRRSLPCLSLAGPLRGRRRRLRSARAQVDGVALTLVRTDRRALPSGRRCGAVARVRGNAGRERLAGASAGSGRRRRPLDLGVEPCAARRAGGRRPRGLLVHRRRDLVGSGRRRRSSRARADASCPNLPVAERLHAEASARFDAGAGRTEITLDHTDLGQGVATAEASVELPDSGDPVVRHAQGDVDLARLLRWVPAGLVPVTAERAQVPLPGRLARRRDRFSVCPRVGRSPSTRTCRTWRSAARSGRSQVGRGKLSFARAAGDGRRGRGPRVGQACRHAARVGRRSRRGWTTWPLDLDGSKGADGEVAGSVGVRFARVERGGRFAGRGRATVTSELRVQGLHPDADEPSGHARRRRPVARRLRRSTRARSGPGRSSTGSTLHAHTLLEGHAPYAVELEAPLSRGFVCRARRQGLSPTLRRASKAGRDDVLPDFARPVASRGVIQAVVDLGETAGLARRDEGARRGRLRASAPRHEAWSAVRPFLPARADRRGPLGSNGGLPCDRAATSSASAAADPAVRQTTEVDVEHPAFENVAAQSLSLDRQVAGNRARSTRPTSICARRGSTVDGGEPERRPRHALGDRGPRAPVAPVPARRPRGARPRRSRRRCRSTRAAAPSRTRSTAHLAGLAPARAAGSRRCTGSKASTCRSSRSGSPRAGRSSASSRGSRATGPSSSSRTPRAPPAVEGTADLRVAHFHWAQGDTAIIAPAARVARRHARRRRAPHAGQPPRGRHAAPRSRDPRRRPERDPRRRVRVASPGTCPIRRPSSRSTSRSAPSRRTSSRSIRIGDVAFALSAERGPEGLVHISDLKLANAAGGTALEAHRERRPRRRAPHALGHYVAHAGPRAPVDHPRALHRAGQDGGRGERHVAGPLALPGARPR